MKEAERVSRARIQRRAVSIRIDGMVQEAENYRDEDEANKSKIVTRWFGESEANRNEQA